MRLIIFSESENSHRVLRFQEEAKKRTLQCLVVNTNKLALSDCNVFYGESGEVLNIGKDDILWFVSNSKINHYLIKKFSSKAGFVWPSVESLDFADKFTCNEFFSEIGIATPKTVLVNVNSLENVKKYLGDFPWVIKKNMGSGGKHVGLVKSKEGIEEFTQQTLLKKMSNSLVPRGNRAFLLQEFIKESAGEDFRVICIDGKAVGCIRRVSGDDFRANVSLGGEARPCELDGEMAELAEKISKEGKLFYGGIDFIKGKRGYLAIEINTSAQFEGFEGATGINIAGSILDAVLKK